MTVAARHSYTVVDNAAHQVHRMRRVCHHAPTAAPVLKAAAGPTCGMALPLCKYCFNVWL